MTAIIGASLPRPDALGKVTGATRYPADLVQPGMLQLKVVFAHRPHARVLAIDTEAALRHPGVVAVLTAADVPFNAYGLIDNDQQLTAEQTGAGHDGEESRATLVIVDVGLNTRKEKEEPLALLLWSSLLLMPISILLRTRLDGCRLGVFH